MKFLKTKEEKQATADAQSEFGTFVALLDGGSPQEVRAAVVELKNSPSLEALSGRQRRSIAERAFQTYTETVLEDDLLTADEELAFLDVADAVGFDGMDDLQAKYPQLIYRLAIAQANDGRLGVIEEPHILPKKNEVVHLEMAAALMKEVTLREFRGGSTGFSFPIAKGVRYRTGAFRGRSVVVGTELQVADTGALAVTSSRAIFLGTRKTIEVAYSKLIGVEVFSDGIRFSVSNRQNASLFKLDNGEVVAATVNAAIQRLEG
jgi:hypothetical protein